MKTALLASALAICLLSACINRTGPLNRVSDFTGKYQAEHTIDTIENLWLRPDGTFAFEFGVFPGGINGYEGRWEIREQQVVLMAKDEQGAEIEFPLQVASTPGKLALIYSPESYRAAKATMILPNSFRRTSRETADWKIRPPEKTPGK